MVGPHARVPHPVAPQGVVVSGGVGAVGAPGEPVLQCTLGKSLYNFAGNERRQELFMTQALESD